MTDDVEGDRRNDNDQIYDLAALTPTADIGEVRSWLQRFSQWLRAREPVATGSIFLKFLTYGALIKVLVGLGLATENNIIKVIGDPLTPIDPDDVSEDPEEQEPEPETVVIYARDMHPSVTAGCAALATIETAATKPNLTTLDFDKTTQEGAQFEVLMPPGWPGGTFHIEIYWSHSSGATAYGVAWEFDANVYDNNESMSVAFIGSALITDTGATRDTLYTTDVSEPMTINGSDTSAGSLVLGRIRRTPTDAADTLDIDARLHLIKFILGDVPAVFPVEFECLDGPVWFTAAVPATTTYPLYSVSVGGGVAVAVSNSGGTPYAVYSLDQGATWSAASISGFSGFPGGAYSPVYGGGVFYAAVNAIQGMRSTDGQTWSDVTHPSIISDRNGYAFGNFVIIGLGDTNGILYSSDASSWTSCTGLPAYSNAATGIASNGTVAIFGGLDGTGAYTLSTADGSTWARNSAPWSTDSINALACNGSRFVTVGQSNSGSDAGWYSDDGTTWTSMSLVGTGISTNVWRDVIYNAGIFIAVSENSTDVSISEDGITWALSTNAMVTGGATSIAASGNNYIAQDNTSLATIRVGTCPAVGADPYFTRVVLLIQPVGIADGVTAFTDLSSYARALTTGGNAQVLSEMIELDGTGDYIEAATSADFAFGTNDYCIEAFVTMDSLAGGPCIVSRYEVGGVRWEVQIDGASGKLIMVQDASSPISTSGTVVTTGTEYHVAWCRTGTASKFFIGGAEVYSGTDSNNYTDYTRVIRVGITANAISNAVNGRLRAVRVTNGSGRYTAAFTPPTSFPTS